ncbi:MAG: acyl-CoA thioester hydrolase/BAAT C-terminal domain-containing protein [Actinomycetota bacterium]
MTAFALGYFGSPGLPRALVEIPIEALRSGVHWFRERFAEDQPVGVMGSSKGAELALVLGSRLGDAIGRIVAVAPTYVAWYGLDQTDPTSGNRSSWTWRGRPVPFLRYSVEVQPDLGPAGMRVDMCYDLARYEAPDIEAATIQVERCHGPILLLSGSDDHMFPAAFFAKRIVERLSSLGRDSDVTSVVYPGAGHAFLHSEFFANVDAGGRPIWDFGGDPEADKVAATDAWPRILSPRRRVPSLDGIQRPAQNGSRNAFLPSLRSRSSASTPLRRRGEYPRRRSEFTDSFPTRGCGRLRSQRSQRRDER